MKTVSLLKKIRKTIGFAVICIVISAAFSVSALAATPYEVTKSGGADVRVSYSKKAASVRKAANGSIVWVETSKKNSAGNLWYQLTDKNWIYSENVKKHTCTWSWVSGYDPTCTSAGEHRYNCNKCGSCKIKQYSALGHNYSKNVCTVCKTWKASSLKSTSSVDNVKYYVTADVAKVHAGPYGGCTTLSKLYKGQEIIVTQKVKNAEDNVWYKYSGGYVFGDYVVKHSSCSYNVGTVTKQPTCTSEGSIVRSCKTCGKSITATIAKTSHTYSKNVCTVCKTWKASSLKSTSSVDNVKYYVTADVAKVHAGPYGGCTTLSKLYKGQEIIVTQKVKNAEDNVWYKYSGGYVFEDYVVKHSSCSYNSGIVTKQPTCTSEGSKVKTCKICGNSKTSAISKTSHKYKDNVCTVCKGWKASSLKSKTDLNNDKFYVKVEGTKIHAGPYGKCKVAKKLSKGSTVIIIQKVENSFGNIWYKCDGGYIYEDYIVKHNSCSYDAGKVTKKASCSNDGVKIQTCKICGKVKNTTISKLSHKYKDYICTVCGTWQRASLKSKTSMNNVEYYVKTEGTKIHSGPYGKCKVVKKLSKGSIVLITQKVENGYKNTWYKCSEGYIYKDYIKDYALHTAKTTLKEEKSTLYVTQEKKLTATVKGPSSKVTWKSSDSSVATVSSTGVVTAKKAGTCTITAKANGKSDTCKITVKALGIPKSVTFTGGARNFKVSHKAVSDADGYEVTYRKMGQVAAKTYTKTSATVKIPKGNADTYICSVRAYKEIGGKKYYGKSSKETEIHIHNDAKNLSVQYLIKDASKHTTIEQFQCMGCGIYEIKSTVNHNFVCGVCQDCGYVKSGYVAAKIYPTVGNGPGYLGKTYKNEDGQKPFYAAVRFSDKVFSSTSSELNESICRLSAIGAAVSYNKKYAKEFLEDCGFEDVEPMNSSDKSSTLGNGTNGDNGNDHARFIIGHKKMSGSNETLVAVLVNGYTTGKYEWVSNFNVGKSGMHEGFYKASQEVTKKVKKYIADQNIDPSGIKIWITGHSRGGAVTGMTAVELNKTYGSKNVFAYGFATPNGVPETTIINTSANLHNNIFNIVNKGDFVPYVAPADWGFTKYGRTIELSVGTKAKGFYEAMSKDSYSGLSIAGNKAIIDAFCNYASSVEDYYSTRLVLISSPTGGMKIVTAAPSEFGRALGLLMCGKTGEALGIIERCAVVETAPSAGVLWNMGTRVGQIKEAHGVETYLALVHAYDMDKHKNVPMPKNNVDK